MNIHDALNSANNIVKSLKKLEKHPRCPPIEEVYTKKEVDIAHSETLRRCLPFISKIIKEAKNYIQNFDEKTYESILQRKKFIEARLLEAKESFEEQKMKNKIISEIENLEKLNIQKFDKILIDEPKSIQIIDYLFEECEDCAGLPILDNFIKLNFDRSAGEKTESFEKILQILQQ